MKQLSIESQIKVPGAGGNAGRAAKYAASSDSTGCRADLYVTSDYCAKKLEVPRGTYIGPR